MLAAGEAQPVIGMSHPLARQPGGGREEEKEGGRKERKGREGELEGSLGSVQGYSGPWSVAFFSTRAPNSSPYR